MGIPNVSVKKSSQGGSPALQSTQGILAILAGSSTGAVNTPSMMTNQSLITSNFGFGPLPEYSVYVVDVGGNPVVAQRCNTSVAATYGAVTKSGTGTFTVAATSATFPYEHYSVIVTFVNGGTLGTAGITYTWSVDGGDTTSGVVALGTGVVIALPNTGVSFTLATTAVGTVVAGDSIQCFTERALMNNSDLTTSLAALNNTRLPWEGALFDCAYATGTIGLIDTWLGAREANGQFNFGLINTRFLTEPTPTGETPTAYAAAMTTLTSADSSNRICVGADGGHVVSLITGFFLKRPTALALGGMAMSLGPNIGTSPNAVKNGPVVGYQISLNNNPNDWDEALYGPSLDPLRLTTLRSFAPGGPTGCYITNANVLAPSGSNIIWLQLLRVLNKACSISWQVLLTQLGNDVDTQFDTTSGAVNIKESAAQTIEGLVNAPLASGLKGQVVNQKCSLNRDDDLSIEGSTINADVAIVPKFYIGGFQVLVSLVKTITVPTGGV